MNLAPVYELRNRLRASMIAGTNLLSEDFRLKRAAEEIKPLETLSPVFAKIGQLVAKLLAEDCTDRENVLIDTITLVDAVLCTQGMVAVQDEVVPIEISGKGKILTNAPYSVVKGLVEALTTSGNGHYQLVVDTHEQSPELFEDYRVKSAMVAALGAGYNELADLVAKWLMQEGEAIVPVLQKDFDPEGKKEMVRRVLVMETVAGGNANDFYIKMIPLAKRDVKNELIYALRHNQENVEYLLELLKKEKGNAKKMVYYALAEMEDERAEKVFRELYGKDPIDAMIYLRMTTTKWASKLVGESMISMLARCKEPDYGKEGRLFSVQETEQLRMIVEAFMGKTGAEICDAYRMAVAVPAIYYSHEKDKKIQTWQMHITGRRNFYYTQSQGLAGAMSYFLESSIRSMADEELCALALELFQKSDVADRNKPYFPAAVVAKLLEKEECSAWLRKQLYNKGLLGEKKQKDLSVFLGLSLRGLVYDKVRGGYYLQTRILDDANEEYVTYEQPVTQDIGGAFMDVLIEYCSDDADQQIIKFINRKDEACRKKLEDYFYKRALTGSTDSMKTYWAGMRECGSERCEGLFVKYVKRQGNISGWDICSSVRDLPGTAEAFEKETETVYQMICKGEIKVQYHWNEELYKEYVEETKAKKREMF